MIASVTTRDRVRGASSIRGPSVLAAVVGLLVARGARADPLPALEVQRSPAAYDCPDARTLAAGVEAKMKRPALDPSSAGPPAFTVQIDRTTKGYSATVLASGRLRSIADDGASCAGLADALEITLAILLDEEAPQPPTGPPPRPAGPPPAKPAIWLFSPNELPPPDPVPLAPPRIQFVARALATTGLTWPAAFGFDLRVLDHLGKRWSLAASLLDVPSRGERRLGGSVEVGLLAATAGPCVRAVGRRENVGVDLCAALDLGALTGVGVNFRTNATHVKTWGAAEADASLGGSIVGPLLWSVRVGGVVPFVRETFLIQGGGTTAGFVAAPVGGVAGAGLGLTIW